MNRIYLDSNVLIAYYSIDRAEETKRKAVEQSFAVFADLKDVQLCTSMWAVTEMVNILVSGKNLAVESWPRSRVSLSARSG